MSLSRRKVAKYFLLPGLLPRFGRLFGTGFAHIALFMAHAYRAVRLLPPNHPYLRPENTGKYGIFQVMGEARRQLVYRRENIDQIIIFYMMALGLILMVFQIGLLLFSLTIKGAFAAGIGSYFSQFFATPSSATDIAFRLMDRVFCLYGDGGAPLYGSDVVGTLACSPTSKVHQALHNLFYFYNFGILAVGMIIMLYMVTTVVAETAQTGTAFGRRFNRGVAPIRLILAVSLLTPFAYGFNGAQHLTFRMAKWGSGLATNGWTHYLCAIQGPCAGTPGEGLVKGFGPAPGVNTPLGNGSRLVATPNYKVGKGGRDFNGLMEFAFVSHTCRYLEEWINRRDLDGDDTPDQMGVYQVYGTDSVSLSGLSFNQALTNAGDGDIYIRIGLKDPAYEKERGGVYPFCGEIAFSVKDIETDGAMAIQKGYWDTLKFMILMDPDFIQHGEWVAQRVTPTSAGGAQKDPLSPVPDAAALQAAYVDYYNTWIAFYIKSGVTAQIADPEWMNYPQNLGWGGAGIWFNKVSQMNGSLAAAARNFPAPSKYPSVMEWVMEQRKTHDESVDEKERFNPQLSDGQLIDFSLPGDIYVAMGEYYAYTMWVDMHEKPQATPVLDMVKALFGTEGLFNMMDNVEVHPLVQLTQVGRSLVESAVRNFTISFGGSVIGMGARGLLDSNGIADIASGVSSFAMKVGMIGLSLGFILYYVVPFLPFIYFFFAIGGWIKGIFEALVGLPLWALAHIRIDGEGIPGPVAMNGYYLIFEIFIRPFLIIVGLVAALGVFTAQVSVLHHIWGLVVTNVAGADVSPLKTVGVDETGGVGYFRDAFDSFMYTVLYTIIVFMMAMSSFKLIDQIPNSILRWMGASVTTFNDSREDAAAGMLHYMYAGTNKALGGFQSGVLGLIGRNG